MHHFWRVIQRNRTFEGGAKQWIERMNAGMIREGIPMSERLKKLRSVAYYQMQSLTRNKSIEQIKDNLIERKLDKKT